MGQSETVLKSQKKNKQPGLHLNDLFKKKSIKQKQKVNKQQNKTLSFTNAGITSARAVELAFCLFRLHRLDTAEAKVWHLPFVSLAPQSVGGVGLEADWNGCLLLHC